MKGYPACDIYTKNCHLDIILQLSTHMKVFLIFFCHLFDFWHPVLADVLEGSVVKVIMFNVVRV